MAAALRLALLGDPVAHSLSPRCQEAALRSAGLEGSYEAILTAAGTVASRLAELAESNFDGLNVTVPLKEESYRVLAEDPAAASRLSPAARAVAAVNTLRREESVWAGHNTDSEGFKLAAQELGAELAGCRAVILGAGGAARAVLWALIEAGASRVEIWNRGRERLERLLADFASLAAGVEVLGLPADMSTCPPGTELIVQASSLGLSRDDPLPRQPAARECPFCLDLVTHETPWQGACRAAGCVVGDGRTMLLWQGAAAFTYWTGRPAPVAAMREALFGN